MTLLWDANQHSQAFSRDYDETWVEKLYRGFARHLSEPFRFVVFVDRFRRFAHPEIAQEPLARPTPSYADCIEPFRLGVPMILTGLDTVVTGNCDRLARMALNAPMLALPRDPYAKERACNGVVVVPEGKSSIYAAWRGENDMEWLRAQPHAFLDDVAPGMVVSYKGHVKKNGLGDARIVYFHGWEKPPEAMQEAPGRWLKEHWL